MMREEKNEIFRCGICNKPYPTAYERNKCEYACLKKADERAKILKNAEKEKKRREIQSKIDEIKQLVVDYNKEFDAKLNVRVEVNTDYSDYCFTHVSESMNTKTVAEMTNEALARACLTNR